MTYPSAPGLYRLVMTIHDCLGHRLRRVDPGPAAPGHRAGRRRVHRGLRRTPALALRRASPRRSRCASSTRARRPGTPTPRRRRPSPTRSSAGCGRRASRRAWSGRGSRPRAPPCPSRRRAPSTPRAPSGRLNGGRPRPRRAAAPGEYLLLLDVVTPDPRRAVHPGQRPRPGARLVAEPAAGSLHPPRPRRRPTSKAPRRGRTPSYGSARIMPPSTGTMAPVTNEAAGDSRNAPTLPISATSP